MAHVRILPSDEEGRMRLGSVRAALRRRLGCGGAVFRLESRRGDGRSTAVEGRTRGGGGGGGGCGGGGGSDLEVSGQVADNGIFVRYL